jgi:hypothetical protein
MLPLQQGFPVQAIATQPPGVSMATLLLYQNKGRILIKKTFTKKKHFQLDIMKHCF